MSSTANPATCCVMARGPIVFAFQTGSGTHVHDEQRSDTTAYLVFARQRAHDAVYLETSVHDPVAQRVRSKNVVITDGGVKLYPIEIRYAWPSELDLMARLAGLRLRARWGGWSREAFGASSGAHVSVYEKGSP